MQVKRNKVLSVTVHTTKATTVISSKNVDDIPDTFYIKIRSCYKLFYLKLVILFWLCIIRKLRSKSYFSS